MAELLLTFPRNVQKVEDKAGNLILGVGVQALSAATVAIMDFTQGPVVDYDVPREVDAVAMVLEKVLGAYVDDPAKPLTFNSHVSFLLVSAPNPEPHLMCPPASGMALVTAARALELVGFTTVRVCARHPSPGAAAPPVSVVDVSHKPERPEHLAEVADFFRKNSFCSNFSAHARANLDVATGAPRFLFELRDQRDLMCGALIGWVHETPMEKRRKTGPRQYDKVLYISLLCSTVSGGGSTLLTLAQRHADFKGFKLLFLDAVRTSLAFYTRHGFVFQDACSGSKDSSASRGKGPFYLPESALEGGYNPSQLPREFYLQFYVGDEGGAPLLHGDVPEFEDVEDADTAALNPMFRSTEFRMAYCPTPGSADTTTGGRRARFRGPYSRSRSRSCSRNRRRLRTSKPRGRM